jgi:hypothetical protein
MKKVIGLLLIAVSIATANEVKDAFDEQRFKDAERAINEYCLEEERVNFDRCYTDEFNTKMLEIAKEENARHYK